jgi:hypothetical protein
VHDAKAEIKVDVAVRGNMPHSSINYDSSHRAGLISS